ncbi:kinase domain protein (macronuclear) [Tetrahymena thermophila SB210]|uniref:Kinase domain protein n=1 Tax=Tetrahymena thermophila (strain SB210) TaxID=312017 RepID=Q22X58_TETTS|nr:kinase domain protein [Tetrahymena thermophila SB210]EAR89788.1 kinase domain protein [Tetrahymena thermophila SB210]|eukprot:XP_001010033.1 kinase domain protein [Tetrahymena thermophila SB210]
MSQAQKNLKLKILQKSFQVKNSGYIAQQYCRADDKRLGAGGFGEIFRIVEKTQNQDQSKMQCLKKVSQQDRSQALNEINSLKILSHPNILKFYEYFENQKNIFLVLEYIEGLDMIDFIQKDSTSISEKVAATIMKQLLEALAYTHDKKIVHRDIKCENIMIIKQGETQKSENSSQENSNQNAQNEQNFKVKLIDWGFSYNLGLMNQEYIESKSLMGTYYYISPEQIQKQKYNSKCDIWAAGVVMYCLLNKQFPFFSNLKFQDRFMEYQQVSLSQFHRNMQLADTQSQNENECSAAIQISAQTISGSTSEQNQNNQQNQHSNSQSTVNQTQAEQKDQKPKLTKSQMLNILHQAKIKFENEKSEDIFDKILNEEPSYDDNILSGEAIDLLRKMLNKNQSQRPSAKDLLRHPWFQNSYNMNVENEKIKENLQKLKNFTYENEFQMAVWMYISSHLVEDNEKKELELIFKKLDKDNSGTLSKEEIKQGFEEMEVELNQQDLDQIFDQIDTDKNGFIDYNEFLASTISHELISNQNYLKKVFKLIDLDKNGSISLNELKNILGSPDQRVNAAYQSVFEDIFSQIDINSDGEISFEEFEKLITSHICQQSKSTSSQQQQTDNQQIQKKDPSDIELQNSQNQEEKSNLAI